MNFTSLLFALIAIPFDAGQEAPVMLDFTATWCGPCRQMKPGVESLSRQGLPIKAIDIDKLPEVAERYQVTQVPTFIVIEPGTGKPIAEISGFRPTAEIASFYTEAKQKYLSSHQVAETEDVETVSGEGDAREAETAEEPESRPGRSDVNPKPWETVVRIKVHGQGSIGYGSGTIIYSSPTESIILTCAHIFKLERGPQAQPANFPRRITLDLFDGNLVGTRPSMVHYSQETFDGKAVDYDFDRDVGLIRFRPGRRLPFARVVPAHWKPSERMGMTTVGCSEGRDATAWNTVILNPRFKGMVNGNGGYEAIECERAPIQGRSGGGLFTSDGYVAGVCDFAETSHNRGLYASPKSIYSILDRNNLMALYAPVRSQSDGIMASREPRTPKSAPVRVDLASRARAQSPDRDDSGDFSLPDPEMFQIKVPKLASNRREPVSATSSRDSWHPIVNTREVDVKLDRSSDADHFDQIEAPAEPAEATDVRSDSRKPVYAPGDWRPVSEVTAGSLRD